MSQQRTTGVLAARVLRELVDVRNVMLSTGRSLEVGFHANDHSDYASSVETLSCLRDAAQQLNKSGHMREAEAVLEAYRHCSTPTDFGGLGYPETESLDAVQTNEVVFFVSAYLEALNYEDRATTRPQPLKERPSGRRGMTLAEKILAAHDVSGKSEVKPGDVIRLDVDWIIASELSWSGMDKTYKSLNAQGIFRNDRLWIAGDHVVDPRVMDHPRIKPLVEASQKAQRVHKLTNMVGMNYTIMHTEFCRERAQPGMLVIGSDSHTCSAGSVSCLAIGLGVADVTLPLVTGETWIKVPETLEIRFINKPRMGMGGKDVILHILKQLKRNTVAADRIVEYTGPGLEHLSCDARFAFCNMATEFGAVTGICVGDEITQMFVDRRKNPKHKSSAHYYRPDADAQYADSYTIDLHDVEPYVARYPSPDDVVPVSDVANTKLDGCFIGACTTAREDLVLAALVLEAGLQKGFRPVNHGKRKVVPGSRPILHELRQLGLIDIYEQAGFEIGVPSCSYCVGMSADKAGEGEVWLSSQNRNFENRMGPGSFGSITSAVTVAASSFEMKIRDPADLIDLVDSERLQDLLSGNLSVKPAVQYVEPAARKQESHKTNVEAPSEFSSPTTTSRQDSTSRDKIIKGKVQTLPDFIDTDALAPNEAIVQPNLTPAQLGEYCLYHTHPHFRERVKNGMNIVVAGKAFGVGSSRENAVTALQGAGVQCVIARSFAFIYARNQPALGMMGIVMNDERFYDAAVDGVEIEVRVDERTIVVNDSQRFDFTLSDLEIRLWEQGGMTPAFRKWGKETLKRVTASESKPMPALSLDQPTSGQTLDW